MKTKIKSCFCCIVMVSALCLSNTVLSQVPCYTVANTYSFTYNTHAYKVIKSAKNWTTAASCAASDGGYLVEINDQAEQTAVYNGIVASSVAANYSPVNDGGGASYMWIGGNDLGTEGDWIWDGNNDLSGTKFWTGQGAAGANNGSPFGGAFVNWGGKSSPPIEEPDDFFSNQDGAAIALSSWPYGIAGEWNDIAASNSIYFIIEYNTIPTSLTNTQKDVVKVFFDKTSNKLKIENAEAVYKVSVLDIQGKIISLHASNDVKDESVDLSKLNDGVYLVKYVSEAGDFKCIKIIK